MNIFGRNSKITINGKSYSGNNITINDGVVIVDGVTQDDYQKEKIELTILCNVEKIISDQSIHIKGNVVGDLVAKTSINCNDVKGSVTAGTSVNCNDIEGDARAGTSINCNDIKGDAKAVKIFM